MADNRDKKTSMIIISIMTIMVIKIITIIMTIIIKTITVVIGNVLTWTIQKNI